MSKILNKINEKINESTFHIQDVIHDGITFYDINMINTVDTVNRLIVEGKSDLKNIIDLF